MKNLVLLSGLGADRRVFDALDLGEYETTPINWIEPLSDEAIGHYATRLLPQITTEKPILIGVSFGGMIAVEISKQIPVERVILISSVSTRREIPFYFRLAGKLRLHKLVPGILLRNPNSLTYWLFGAETQKERELLKSFMQQTNIHFMKWAIDTIVNWQNKIILTHLVRIHGTADRLLPFRSTNYKVDRGSHLMIINQSAEITAILNKILKEK